MRSVEGLLKLPVLSLRSLKDERSDILGFAPKEPRRVQKDVLAPLPTIIVVEA